MINNIRRLVDDLSRLLNMPPIDWDREDEEAKYQAHFDSMSDKQLEYLYGPR